MIVQRAVQEVRLVDIALLPEHRNAGIGTALIQSLIDEASRAGKALRLQVLRASPGVRLYERLGFVPVRADAVYLQMEVPAKP